MTAHGNASPAKKRLTFALLYFSEGAPIGFVWWALPGILAERGHSLSEIATLTALATLPWSLKFLMAPFIDVLSLGRAGLKRQLAGFQLAMGLTALAFAPLIETGDLALLGAALLLHAVCAAGQDVCIDALAIRSVNQSELGTVNGWMQAGMLVGRSLFGGAGLYIAHAAGLPLLGYLLVAAIWTSLVLLALSRVEARSAPPVTLGGYFRNLGLQFSRPAIWLLLLTAYLAGLSFEGIGGVASATLARLEVDAGTRGLLYGVAVPLCMLTGALIGGLAADRTSKPRALRRFLIFTGGMSILVAAGFDHVRATAVLVAVVSVFYFGIGLLTAALYAYLMQHTDKLFAAFQFSLFMAATNLCESSATYVTGQLAPQFGFTPVTATLVLFSLLVLGLSRQFDGAC